MVTEFKVEGWWRAEEAAGAASALLSRHAAGNEFLNPPWTIQVQAETEESIVRIISDNDLTVEQITILRNYFENHPYQEMPEQERTQLIAEKARREALLLRVHKLAVAGDVAPADLQDAVRALAELVGVDVGIAKDAK